MGKALRLVWRLLDSRLRRLSETLQRLVRTLRWTRRLLWLGIILVLASAAVGIVAPKYFPYAYAVATIFLVLPLAILAVVVGLPLRAKSMIRLIDMGYPSNAREFGIRFLTRKMRDESIETEELLYETALNEAKKYLRKMREKEEAEEGDDGDEDDDDEGPRGAQAA
jgi:hypothetical protein